jgi:hypothetical protein
MATLNGAIKVFIVERLACFDTPTEVQKAVKQAFKVDVSLQQLTAYNPKLAAGERLSQTLKDLFEVTRKRYLDDTSGIAIANKAYRLGVMQKLLDTALSKGNVGVIPQLLEQAAKEEGGAFTNKQKLEHAGKDGGPLVVTVRRFGNG